MKIEVHSPTIRRKEMDAVLTAMVEDQIGPGERTRLLIQTAKEHLRFDFALALRSPATALHLALRGLDLKDGDGVLLSALSPRYYAQVLSELRLVPLYCDVPFSFPCVSRETVEKAIETKPAGVQPRCVVLHHTLGYVPDTLSIASLGLPIIEDISQSYAPALAEEQGETAPPETAPPQAQVQNQSRPPAINGVYGILGLEERDMLTSGGGALLFAMSRRDGTALRALSNIPPEYSLPDINAALAVVQFREAQRNTARRHEIAQVYTQSSLRTKHKRFAAVNAPAGESEGAAGETAAASAAPTEYSNYAFPLVLETGMKDVIAYARKKEIIVENAFEQSLAGAGISDSVLCPASYSLSLRTVLFPLYPRLRAQDIQRVSKLIMTLP